MEALIVAFQVMAPIFILMSVGFGARKFGILNDIIIRPINNLLFRVFLPAMLFVSIYNVNIDELFNMKLIAYVTIVTLVVFFAAFFLVPRFEKKRSNRSPYSGHGKRECCIFWFSHSSPARWRKIFRTGSSGHCHCSSFV